MRTASLRSGVTPFRRVSEVAPEYSQLRRTRVPDQAEVVAVHGDDDWFALFADEGEKAARLTEIAAPQAVPPLEPWEFARFAPERDPAWLRFVPNWRVATWSGIAALIVFGAGVLLFATRYFGVDDTIASADMTTASAPGETGATAPPAVLTHSVVYAPPTSTAPAPPTSWKPAPRTKAAPPPRAETRISRVAERSVAFAPPSSARPTPTPKPAPIPIPIPTPTLISTLNAAAASSPNPAPPTTRMDVPSRAVVAPPATSPAAPAPPSETVLIRSLLDLYRQAYSSLDADAVAAVWPSVNTRSLARAFSQIESQRFEFTDCRIDVSVARAQAICAGKASYVPKVGGRSTRSENREWAFVFQKLNDGWIISRAEAR